MIKLSSYKLLKKLLDDTITNNTFKKRLLIESFHDETFGSEITNYISVLLSNISAAEFANIFFEIRNKTISNFECAKNENDKNKRVDFCMRSLAYFYLLESLDEYSIIGDNIINDIKRLYPKNYLEILADVDKTVLSLDAKKVVKKANSDLINKDIFKKYLTLKQWQDSQHYFFEGDYWRFIKEVHVEYLGEDIDNGYVLEQKVLHKRLIDSLKNDVIDLDTCSILTSLPIKEHITNLIGGKMYGLSILNYLGLKVPYTVVIPIGMKVDSNKLKKLKKYEYYSVRSSANIEDNEKNSFAGMFDSYLNVSFDDLICKINMVRDSVNNKRLLSYIKKYNLDNPKMAVVIQSYEEPQYAGVWIGKNSDEGILEWVEGNGEKLVSGSCTPHTEFWNNNNLKDSLKLNRKSIGKIMLEYQKLTGDIADFEWMILNKKLIMLQYRPVTIVIEANCIDCTSSDITGIPSSSGIISGNCQYLDSPEEDFKEGNILITYITEPNWVPILTKASGVITARGGILCHTAIIARELGIPCITGIGRENLEKVKQAKKLEINGNNGHITIKG